MTSNDGLFLLEVLIDKIVFAKSPCFSDKDFRTCVLIECPAVDALEICDDEPGSCVAKSGGPFVKTFNTGKSCLFSLKESDITSAMARFPVKVSVYKSLPCGCLPTKIIMGEATIDMTKEFVHARNKQLEDPNSVNYQALKDSFRITGPDGGESGEIVMFMRISSFGSLIVTRFQGTGPPTLGTGGQPAIVDRSCNPPREYQSLEEPCVCGATHGKGGGRGSDGQPCQGGGSAVCPPARDYYKSMPCEDPDDLCYCTGLKKPPRTPMACRNTDPYCLHIPKGRSKQYEEIGMNLSGNELKIKVPANSALIKKISQTNCALQCPYSKSKGGEREGPCVPPCGKNQIILALPSEPVCCHDAQLANTQFSCTTEGCVQVSRHGPQTGLGRGDTRGQEPPNRDSFVLNVKKTALQGDRKVKIELELVTPKVSDKKPPVEKINTRVQSNFDCECCRKRLKTTKRR